MHPSFVAIDPLFLAHTKLFIKDIYGLKTMENSPIELYHFYEHIIKFVDISGVIVGVETMSSQVIYTVDDGTATIACCLWNEKLNVNYKPLSLGTSIRVLGKLSRYCEQTLIDIQDLIVVNDPNQELNHLLTTIQMKQEYAKPYHLPTVMANDKKTIIAQLKQKDPSLIKQEQKDNMMMNGSEAFNKALHDYLKLHYPNNQEFTVLQQARNDTELEKMAIHAYQIETCNPNAKPKPVHISTIFKNGIKSLAQQRLVCHVPQKTDWYTLMDQHYIERLIMNTIKDILQEEIPWRGGASIDYIQIKICKDPLYKGMKAPEIINELNPIITSLVNRGYLYPTAEKEYKVSFL